MSVVPNSSLAQSGNAARDAWDFATGRKDTAASAGLEKYANTTNGRFVMVYPVVPSMNEAIAGFEIS